MPIAPLITLLMAAQVASGAPASPYTRSIILDRLAPNASRAVTPEARDRIRAEAERERDAVRVHRDDWRKAAQLDWNSPPSGGAYDPSWLYRPGDPVTLRVSDRLYRGGDGRYYCRREDGTTGLVQGFRGGNGTGQTLGLQKSAVISDLVGAQGGRWLNETARAGTLACR